MRRILLKSCVFMMTLSCVPATVKNKLNEDKNKVTQSDTKKTECKTQFNFLELPPTPPRIKLYQALRAKKPVTFCIGSVAVKEREKINKQVWKDVNLAFNTWLAALGPQDPILRPEVTFKNGRCSGNDAIVNVTAYGDVAIWNKAECSWSDTGTCFAHVDWGVNDAFIDPYHLGIVNPAPWGVDVDRDYGEKIILHEMGHIFGLDDLYNKSAPQPKAIMNTFVDVLGYNLTPDDVKGIKSVYSKMAAYDVAASKSKPTAAAKAKSTVSANVGPLRLEKVLDSATTKMQPTSQGEPPRQTSSSSDCQK